MAIDSGNNRQTGASGGSKEGSTGAQGQFSGDDIEFEPFMFDSGQGQELPRFDASRPEGASTMMVPEQEAMQAPVVPEAPTFVGEASDLPSYLQEVESPITGEDMPMPASMEAQEPFTEASATTDQLSATGPFQGSMEPFPSTAPFAQYDDSHASVGGSTWSDSSLSEVEDFSTVLLAIYRGQSMPIHSATNGTAVPSTQAPTYIVDTDLHSTTDTVPYWATHAATADNTAGSWTAPALDAATSPPEWGVAAQEASVPQAGWVPAGQDMPAQYVGTQPYQEPAVAPVEGVGSALTAASATGTSDANFQEFGEGKLSGDDLQFENFMFDPGQAPQSPQLPRMDEFMPAVQGMEQAIQQPAMMDAGLTATQPEQPASTITMPEAPRIGVPSESEEAELPFWLQDAAEVQVTPGQGYVEAAEAGLTLMPTAESAAAGADVLDMESAAPFDPGGSGSYDDLPPIEPFDFSLLEQLEQEEELGLSLDELSGIQPAEHEPMMVTANLEALHALIGGTFTPNSSIEAVEQPKDNSSGHAQEPEPLLQQTQPPPSEEIESKASWTATVTSSLPDGAMDDMMTSQGLAVDKNVPSEMEIGVAPFDYSNLDLQAEQDLSTVLLQASASDTSKMASGTANLGSMDAGGETESITEGPESAWAGENSQGTAALPADTDASDAEDDGLVAREEMWNAVINRTKTFEAPLSEETSTEQPTGRLQDGDTVGDYDTQTDEIKARVAGGMAAPPVAPDQIVATQSSSDLVTTGHLTGPLPTLSGFEELTELLASNPDDIGAYAAMAEAYTQAGQYEHAIQVYRRILKKRNLSASMLQMISDDLSDIQHEVEDLPRYHQVMGDMLMRMGRYKEAIDEYNKMA